MRQARVGSVFVAATWSVVGFGGTLLVASCSGSGDSPSDGSGANDGGNVTDGGGSNDARANADSSRLDGAAGDASADFVPIDLPLTGCPQAGYAGKFAVGGAPFDLVIDTGSAELGVAGATCTSCTGVSPLYTPSAGSVDEMTTTSVSYVSGSGWSGEIIRDTFGAAGSSIAASTRLVAIASESGGFFGTGGCGFGSVPFSFEGIAGFGPAALAKTGTDEPMATIATAGVPDIFSVALCGLGGHLWLGGFDPAAASSAPQYSPLITSDFYAIKVDDLKIAGTALGFSATDIEDVVVDTDTTEFELPLTVYQAARDAIGATASFQAHFGGSSFFSNGSCIVPLDATPPTIAAIDAALPPIAIRIDDGAGGGHDVTLSATQSYIEPVTKNGVIYYCPEIEPRNSGGSTVLGSAFLRSELVIFDRAAKRIGFAPYASCAVR